MAKIEIEKTIKNSGTKEDHRAIVKASQTQQKEYGGPRGKEPTRYGDWEKKGRCIDF